MQVPAIHMKKGCIRISLRKRKTGNKAAVMSLSMRRRLKRFMRSLSGNSKILNKLRKFFITLPCLLKFEKERPEKCSICGIPG
jgi:hypothetical protein